MESKEVRYDRERPLQARSNGFSGFIGRAGAEAGLFRQSAPQKPPRLPAWQGEHHEVAVIAAQGVRERHRR